MPKNNSNDALNVYNVEVKYRTADDKVHVVEVKAGAMPLSKEAHGIGTATFLREQLRMLYEKKTAVAWVQSVRVGRCIDHMPKSQIIHHPDTVVFPTDGRRRNASIKNYKARIANHKEMVEKAKGAPRKRSGSPRKVAASRTTVSDAPVLVVKAERDNPLCKAPKHKESCECGFGVPKAKAKGTKAPRIVSSVPVQEVSVPANVSEILNALSKDKLIELVSGLLAKS